MLSSLAATQLEQGTRGPADPFKLLFAQPFGPKALASFREQREAEPASVYGISTQDTQRMSLLLKASFSAI